MKSKSASISQAARELGKGNGSKELSSRGGHARRDAMTPFQRSESARKAVLARWAKFRADSEKKGEAD